MSGHYVLDTSAQWTVQVQEYGRLRQYTVIGWLSERGQIYPVNINERGHTEVQRGDYRLYLHAQTFRGREEGDRIVPDFQPPGLV